MMSELVSSKSHSGMAATIENQIMARVFVKSIMPSTMYQNAPFCSPEMVQ